MESIPALVVLVGVAAIPVGLAATMESEPYDDWGAFVWGPVMLLLCLPLARWAARRTGDPGVVSFLMGAAVLKLIVGTTARTATAQIFYKGLADAARYDDVGGQLALEFRAGHFGDLGQITGTRFIEVVTGLTKVVTGDTIAGSMVVFSFFAFAGMVMLYVAFCDAVPDGDRRLFRLLLFLVPTMWYWPSSIGKEAFMLLCIGAMALGTVSMLRGQFRGVVLGALGAWGTLVVRPHMTLVFIIGLAAAVVTLKNRAPEAPRPLVAKAAPILLLVGFPIAFGQVEQLLGIEDLSRDSFSTAAAGVSERTGQGGSEFTTADPFTPHGFVLGVVTVLIRPLPIEVSGLQGLVSSVEMLALTGGGSVLLWRNRQALRSALGLPLVRLAIGYSLAFGAAFAAVGNFGILVRQRSLLLPFLFVVVASAVRSGDRPEAPPALSIPPHRTRNAASSPSV